MLSGNCLRQTVHTHRASVHQAAKLVAALLRVAAVTVGLAESNGSLPPGLWLTSPAGWLPRIGIGSGTVQFQSWSWNCSNFARSRVWATFTFLLNIMGILCVLHDIEHRLSYSGVWWFSVAGLWMWNSLPLYLQQLYKQSHCYVHFFVRVSLLTQCIFMW